MKDQQKKDVAIRSSAAEYLTFVASTGESDASYEMRYEDENIWLTQKMMAALYDVTKQTISQHINRIYADGELTPEATVKKYLTVQTEGNRQVSRSQDHYNLQMIIACSAVPQVGRTDRQGPYHSGLDYGCGAPEKGSYVHGRVL